MRGTLDVHLPAGAVAVREAGRAVAVGARGARVARRGGVRVEHVVEGAVADGEGGAPLGVVVPREDPCLQVTPRQFSSHTR